MIYNFLIINHHHVYAQMSNNNGSSADIDSHISKKYEIRRRLGKVRIIIIKTNHLWMDVAPSVVCYKLMGLGMDLWAGYRAPRLS